MPTTSTTLLDVLLYQLDRKVAEQVSDHARYRFLMAQGRIWRSYFIAFAETGFQPFGGPHPDFGRLDVWDFRLLLSDIDARLTALEHAQVA